MYKKVMADMDKTTLLRMRDEEGMTLGEIASAVGCTKSTICRILGPMSPEQRRQRKQQGARSRWSSATEGGYTVERKLQSFMPQAEAAKEEPAAAVLAVKRAPILLSGAFMDYVVSADSQMIDVEKEGRTLIQIPAERLSEFIAELAAISRNIGEQKPMQFWGGDGMKLSELLDCVPETQEILLYGDGICTSIETDAETLTNVLNEETQGMRVTDIEADGSVLKVWIEVADDGK